MKSMELVTYVTLLTIVSHVRAYGLGYDDFVRLRSNLLTGYDKTVRPLLDQADLMRVNITYDIGGIQEIHEVEGTMNVFLTLTYAWIDERIRWNPNDYNNTYSLTLPADSVWKPKLVLIAPADPELTLDSSTSTSTVRYYPNGAAIWYPTSVISVSFVIDIEFYPFDTQECPIMFMLPDYLISELELHAVNREAALQYYVENGIWELVNTESEAVEVGVPMYTVTLTVTRKPTFVIIIVIIPIMLLSFLSIMVFLLPPESGERMSYSITLLLALVVFLTIISDNIPKTSSPLSILSYFIGLHVLLSTFITVATILNLRLYYKDDEEPVPSWLCYCCRKRKTGQLYTTSGYKEHPERITKSMDPSSANGIAFSGKRFVHTGRDNSVHRTKSTVRNIDGTSNWQFHKTFDDNQPRIGREDVANTELTWKDVSRVADWVMFTISIVYFVVVFTVFALLAVFKN